jgi:hypothetical protein
VKSKAGTLFRDVPQYPHFTLNHPTALPQPLALAVPSVLYFAGIGNALDCVRAAFTQVQVGTSIVVVMCFFSEECL